MSVAPTSTRLRTERARAIAPRPTEGSRLGSRRILVVHSRYLSGQTSGENRVVEDEVALLREGGHEVSTVVRQVDVDLSQAVLARDVVWSRSAVSELVDSIGRHDPDIVHFHNLFPAVSPAALRAAHRAGRAVVVTLHNFRFSCLGGTFLRDSKICEDCVGHLPWRGVVHGCYRGSRAQSAVLASSLSVHRLLQTLRGVTLFLALSEFNRAKHIAAGLPADAIRVRRNFAAAAPVRSTPGEYFLYLGRLAPEKGLAELLGGWPPDVRLVVVGDGPERERLARSAPHGVEFRGDVQPDEVSSLFTRARALVVPSTWHEGSPRVILESLAAGVPVLASDIGGLPELVHDGVNGYLLPPGDAGAWQAGVRRLLDPVESQRLGGGALASWRASYSPARGLESLMTAYEEALDLRRAAAA